MNKKGDKTIKSDVRALLERIGQGKSALPKLTMGDFKASSAPTSPAANISIMDFTWDETEARSVKRKRPAECECLDNETRSIALLAKERNTKSEIKESALKLRSLLSQLMTNEAQELLQKLDKTSTT